MIQERTVLVFSILTHADIFQKEHGESSFIAMKNDVPISIPSDHQSWQW
jgi:hypothetical protein